MAQHDEFDEPSHIVPALWQENYAALMPIEPNKDEKSRIGYFLEWLSMTNRTWLTPDLGEYLHYLLYERTKTDMRTGDVLPAPLSPTTANVHLATIRGRYKHLLTTNKIRQTLYAQVKHLPSLADQKAYVDEVLVRIQNDTHPTSATATVITKMDIADSEHLRLRPSQVRTLLRQPNVNTLIGLRDVALIAVLICTGIREAELVALNVDDLRQTLGGEVALLVREGKNHKQRLVPYGLLAWCLDYVDTWMLQAGISDGALFRGILKDGKTVRPTALTVRAVNQIMHKYPIWIDSDLRVVNPHDLRRTYARNAYEFGMDLERIRQNLGHESLQTTQTYIGTLDVSQRRPPRMFNPPHTAKGGMLHERHIDDDE